jgi:hypothetical protein
MRDSEFFALHKLKDIGAKFLTMGSLLCPLGIMLMGLCHVMKCDRGMPIHFGAI